MNCASKLCSFNEKKNHGALYVVIDMRFNFIKKSLTPL